jgi:cell division protein FtsB
MPSPEIISWLEVAAKAATVIAVIAGGVWSVLLSIRLRQWSRGRVELQKLERENKKLEQENKNLEQESRKLEIEIKKAERESIQQAVLNLSMQTNQETIPGDDARYVLVNVEIENKGNRNTDIKFEEKNPLAVRPVNISSSGETAYGEESLFPVSTGRGNVDQEGWVIRAGSRQQLPFCIRLDKPGLYQISFRAKLDKEETAVSSALGKRTPEWWVMKYVVVV